MDIRIDGHHQRLWTTTSVTGSRVQEGSGEMVNQEWGVLTWKIDLKPVDNMKIRFGDSVKYHKDKKIVNPKRRLCDMKAPY